MSGLSSGKKKRSLLHMKRTSERSVLTRSKTHLEDVIVVQQPSHDFRLKGDYSTLTTEFHLREADYEVEKRVEESRVALQRSQMRDWKQWLNLMREQNATRSSNWAPKDAHCAGAVESSKLYHDQVDIPIRPSWQEIYNSTKKFRVPSVRARLARQQQEAEEQSFEEWLSKIYESYSPLRVNHFEHNLQVWRQLWRVCEQSDILMLCADARHPLFHFPPSLYRFVTERMHKSVVLILTKVDLIDSITLQQWLDYLQLHFKELTIIPFTNQPGTGLHGSQPFVNPLELRKERRKDIAEGNRQGTNIFAGVQKVMDALTHMSKQIQLNQSNEEIFEETEEEKQQQRTEGASKSSDLEGQSLEGDASDSNAITVGVIGHPNAGKSSLLNALCGQAVVSVSSTPGHTKHLQTLHLTSSISLLDCPGLVFPAVDMPRSLQVLCGIFPVTQLREPYTAVQYLAERIPVEEMYQLAPPIESTGNKTKKKKNERVARRKDDDEQADEFLPLEFDNLSVGDHGPKSYQWSAMDICEAFARLHGYPVKGSNGRFDAHRAAVDILYDVLQGVIPLYFSPPLKE